MSSRDSAINVLWFLFNFLKHYLHSVKAQHDWQLKSCDQRNIQNDGAIQVFESANSIRDTPNENSQSASRIFQLHTWEVDTISACDQALNDIIE